MAVHVKGNLVALPWNDSFDQFLMKMEDTTYQYAGDDLLHEIHKEAIESKWINVRLHAMVRTRLAIIIAIQLTMFAFVLIR